MSGRKRKASKSASAAAGSGGVSSLVANGSAAASDLPPSAGYLVSCDVPTKQFIQYLNEVKPVDKKFILQDLDATHLLIERKAKTEIEQKVDQFFDSNVFSPVERMGEDFDTS